MTSGLLASVRLAAVAVMFALPVGAQQGFTRTMPILTHPLDPHAGGDNFHSGGRRWRSQDDPEWQMLAAWVRGEETSCAVTDR